MPGTPPDQEPYTLPEFMLNYLFLLTLKEHWLARAITSKPGLVGNSCRDRAQTGRRLASPFFNPAG
jgi:hypothetical protein